jgi:hypothetical protein
MHACTSACTLPMSMGLIVVDPPHQDHFDRIGSLLPCTSDGTSEQFRTARRVRLKVNGATLFLCDLSLHEQNVLTIEPVASLLSTQ